MLDTLTLNIESTVYVTDKYLPLTGVHSIAESLGGFLWDKRLLEDPDIDSSRYLTTIGGHTAGLRDGTQLLYWQSGAIDDLDYLKVAAFKRGEFMTFTPVVNTGRYSTYFDGINLYSDYSYTERFDSLLNENNVNSMTLRDDCINGSISVRLFERTAEFLKRLKYNLTYIENFTGDIDESTGEVLATTDDNDNVLWDNINQRYREFIVKENKVYLNNDYSITIGGFTDTITSNILEGLFEDQGNGEPTGRDLYTQYFPLSNDSVVVYVVSEDGSIRTLTEVTNLNFSFADDEHYSVDYDLGIITLGGYQAPDLYLRTSITALDVDIYCVIDDDSLASFPSTGVIKIENEYIIYYQKSRNGFLGCFRGVYGTTAVAHGSGSTIYDIQHGKGLLETDKLYIGYVAVPQIAYEVTESAKRTANSSGWLDIKNISNSQTNNILQISTIEPNIASLVLTIDKPIIAGNIYGPCFFGTDTARLTATAYDSRGNPVEDVNITIVLDGDAGSLNNGLNSYTSLSNSSGEIYALYNAPYDWDSIGRIVEAVSYVGADTMFMVSDLPPDLDPTTVTTYQVLKQDPSIGTLGLPLVVLGYQNDALYETGEPAFPAGILVRGLFDDAVSRFMGGTAIMLGSDAVLYRRTIIAVIEMYDNYGVLIGYKLGLDEAMEIFDTGIIDKLWLLETQAEEWNSDFLDGVRVLLYEWNTSVQHPLTGALGAYYPLYPNSVDGDTITFNDRILPSPDADDRNNNLGGYIIVTSNIVSFYAYAKDPISGRTITSNTVRLRLDLPSYLVGVDRSGALPIPYGFTFVTEEFNVGTGLGGANFLTINPIARGINMFNAYLKG